MKIRNSGFSLIEVLLALAIFGGMLCIALPSVVHTFRHMQGEQFIDMLGADIYLAANEALSYRGQVRIVFYPQSEFYTVQRMWELKKKKVMIPAGFSVTNNFRNGTIIFNELGHVIQAGTISIVYPNSMKKKVTVYMASGRFSVNTE
ncbi:hypothetical protein AM501_21895 [Aneurinibacillus migulanus]|uniref:type II secretion system protein n=1 Tax=Aneurinibacillus migulanus TaxID=47500 RepID=UPI0005BA5C3F|nr:type II secretion system protein [Aneurinibacillus migulanus]KIV58038.1 hypothetical protein TS64_05705 [Aneurinibacillus migulanus]KPD06259.1 hypothetical protein AM501_21895 [Aneurinibacillus migulanus]MCP1355879.1 type II secretion system GspH family protein [Aneurinibacillus migulanus]CEH28512.1 Prepilin-type cleavage/methylation protein [Aneurinibacillus migulanus]